MILTTKELSIMHEAVMRLIISYEYLQPKDCILTYPSDVHTTVVSIGTAKSFEVDYDAMLSYYNQTCLRFWRKSWHQNNDAKLFQILQIFYHQRIPILNLAKDNRCSSYRLSKAFLERIVSFDQVVSQYKTNRHFHTVSVSDFIDEPDIVDDPWIRQELIHGITKDLLCSPFQEQLKETVGKEYESLLQRKLQDRHMIFETEADLRSQGKAKTPDILLLVPMQSKYDLYSSSGLIKHIYAPAINWIDSKAFFADEMTFEEHKEQFHSYVSRYGRGMVIYWHGFADTLIKLVDEESLVIADHFPSYWRFPTGELADGTVPDFITSSHDMKMSIDEMNRDHSMPICALFQD